MKFLRIDRSEVDRHLNDMREWYRRKMRELAGVDAPPDDVPGELLQNDYRSVGVIANVMKDFGFFDIKTGIFKPTLLFSDNRQQRILKWCNG